MFQGWIILNPFNLRIHKAQHLLFNPLVIGFDSLFEIVGAIFVCEVSDDGNGLVSLISAETLAEFTTISAWKIFCSIRSSKLSETAPTNMPCVRLEIFGSRNKTIELRGDGGRLVVAVDGHRLSLLKNLSEAFRESFRCFAYDLTAKDISHCVLDNLTLLISVITRELREVLEAQTNCYFV